MAMVLEECIIEEQGSVVRFLVDKRDTNKEYS
jgi:hypothetical protein